MPLCRWVDTGSPHTAHDRCRMQGVEVASSLIGEGSPVPNTEGTGEDEDGHVADEGHVPQEAEEVVDGGILDVLLPLHGVHLGGARVERGWGQP